MCECQAGAVAETSHGSSLAFYLALRGKELDLLRGGGADEARDLLLSGELDALDASSSEPRVELLHGSVRVGSELLVLNNNGRHLQNGGTQHKL